VDTTYRLTHPVDGFCRQTGKITTIPAQAILFPTAIQSTIGLCLVFWGAQEIWVESADLRRHAVPNVELGQTG